MQIHFSLSCQYKQSKSLSAKSSVVDIRLLAQGGEAGTIYGAE